MTYFTFKITKTKKGSIQKIDTHVFKTQCRLFYRQQAGVCNHVAAMPLWGGGLDE